MRLREISISNMRGIKSLKLEPNGQNVVIWGPNGSGKSAVVDAIDFLLTGKISCLTGEGTDQLTLRAHGPHVDHSPEEAEVAALFDIPGWGEPVALKRKISAPAKLEFPLDAEEALRPLLTTAAKGHQVLSRRRILQYVAGEAGKRADAVQSLLNLDEIEEIRKALTRTTSAAKKERDQADAAEGTAEGAIQTTLGLDAFSEGTVLVEINERRRKLGGEPAAEVSVAALKRGIKPAAAHEAKADPNVAGAEKDAATLTKQLEQAGKSLPASVNKLHNLLEALRGAESSLRHYRRLKLLRLGVSVLEADGACPLCGRPWEPGKLEAHLRTHIAEGEPVAANIELIEAEAKEIAATAANVLAGVERIATAAQVLGRQADVDALGLWRDDLLGFSAELLNPVDDYRLGARSSEEVAGMFSSPQLLQRVHEVAGDADKRVPTRTPEQEAWDTLTRLEENLRQYEKAKRAVANCSLISGWAKVLETHFEKCRNAVLAALYESIQGRFTELYRAVHGEDEADFESSLRPDGARLLLEVDFYGRGMYPPLAVHSEGHQDTMGIALYLALVERLTSGRIDLIVLDDVVMSVDAGHRRQICHVLKDKFPDRQFLITTHDRTWARQLETTGVVPRMNSIAFSKWTIESGPVLALEKGLWEKVVKENDAGQVESAAHRLRRGAEEFFDSVCDALRAPVPFRSDARYELGDLAPAAIRRYRSLLKDAKRAANSWGNKEAIAKLEELETIARQTHERSQIEQWAINEGVHYSRWSEFRPADFLPVIEAWRDLFALFECTKCGAVLYVAEQKRRPVALRCRCGETNWNLVEKGNQ